MQVERNGPGFEDCRDKSIIRLFLDSRMCLSELTGLSVDDPDLDVKVAYVLRKGQRLRECAFGAKTAQAQLTPVEFELAFIQPAADVA